MTSTLAEVNSTIVIIDHYLEMRQRVISCFTPRGHKVISFSCVSEYLAEFGDAQLPVNLMLVGLHSSWPIDVNFFLRIRKKFPILPIILMHQPNEFNLKIVAACHCSKSSMISFPIKFNQLILQVDNALNEANEPICHGADDDNKNDCEIIGKNKKFLHALEIAKRVANTSASIFIRGESGTGKELFAKFIHHESVDRKGAFVAINCSAIPESLLESELFGHAKGAFTGAIISKIGLFEEAQDGTLFLDEIGDLSLPLQAKLLRVLQEKKIRRVGDNQDRPINCRIISATHKNLSLEVQEQRFREDLFFRLNVIPIEIPPLRERVEDLIPLTKLFLLKYAAENKVEVKLLSKEAMDYVVANPWRGNVRELENIIERAVILSMGSMITLENLMPDACSLNFVEDVHVLRNANIFHIDCEKKLFSLEQIIQKYVEFAVRKNEGAKDKTALEIGIDRKTLYKHLKGERDYFFSEKVISEVY